MRILYIKSIYTLYMSTQNKFIKFLYLHKLFEQDDILSIFDNNFIGNYGLSTFIMEIQKIAHMFFNSEGDRTLFEPLWARFILLL